MGTFERYTLSPNEVDADRILVEWEWVLWGRKLSPIALNRFGDWFLQDPAGAVFWLNVISADLLPVASGLDELRTLSESSENRERWFRASWTDRVAERIPALPKGRTYGFERLHFEGGTLDAEHASAVDPVEYQAKLSGTLRLVLQVPTPSRFITGPIVPLPKDLRPGDSPKG
jgi:hypothetical protein